jgi:hypothetical protein
MMAWKASNAAMASLMELIRAGPPHAELDSLAVDQHQLAVVGQRAVRDNQIQPGRLACTGFAAE